MKRDANMTTAKMYTRLDLMGVAVVVRLVGVAVTP